MPLSAKQMEYLALAWQCFDSEPKIDYAKFATVAGLASAASARELMRVTKNKLKVEYGALSSTLQTSNTNNNNNTTPQPRTPKRKATTTAAGTATPASRKRGWKQKETTRAEREGENENVQDEDAEQEQEQEDAVPEPAKKKARTRAKAASSTTLAAEGGVKVKDEFGFEEGVGEELLAEEEVSIF